MVKLCFAITIIAFDFATTIIMIYYC